MKQIVEMSHKTNQATKQSNEVKYGMNILYIYLPTPLLGTPLLYNHAMMLIFLQKIKLAKF